jgi:hypothetical protein
MITCFVVMLNSNITHLRGHQQMMNEGLLALIEYLETKKEEEETNEPV